MTLIIQLKQSEIDQIKRIISLSNMLIKVQFLKQKHYHQIFYKEIITKVFTSTLKLKSC